MSYRQKLLSRSSIKRLQLGLQPSQAWIAILGLVLFLALCLLAGIGRVLIPVFPLGSLAVGLFLYQRYPVLYVGFTWWMLFLGSLVRRLIDYQSGYVTPGSWSLTSLLVISISFVTLVRYLPKSYGQGGLPFILCFGGVLYGLLIGLVQNGLNLKFITSFLSWSTPILFGFHLFVNWRDYPNYRQNIQRTFLWGVLVMGIYGIWQYLVAPEWDRFYMIELIKGGVLSFGAPEPLGIRVFSTLGSAQTFAAVMMAGLLLLFISQGNLRFPVAGVGYLAFLLSLARSGWLSWCVGLLTFLASLKARLQMRFIIVIVVVVIFVLPLATIEPFSTVIGSRLESLSNPKEDLSYQGRLQGFNKYIGIALSELLGRGMLSEIPGTTDPSGFVIGDNGLLVMLLTFGWFGTIPYIVGLLLLFFKLFQGSESRFDSFASASRAIALGTFSQIGFKTMMEGEMGMVLWSFLGISMAAHKYYQHQHNAEIERG